MIPIKIGMTYKRINDPLPFQARRTITGISSNGQEITYIFYFADPPASDNGIPDTYTKSLAQFLEETEVAYEN